MDIFLKERELAALLAVSVATLRASRLKSQGPKYVKLGSAVRYNRQDVDAWIGSRPAGGDTTAVPNRRIA